LETGDPDFGPPTRVKEAAKNAISTGHTYCTEPLGMQELREGIAQALNDRHRTAVSRDQVLVTCGARFGFYAALQSLLSPGDEVIITQPSWPVGAQVACP
jgi:aspartate/methionine/tyrosine aminotransferase